jgi:hypothetical protein
MTIHRVKSWTPFFEAFLAGDKRHDLRDDDRNYQRGDFLILQEFHPFGGGYSGRELTMEVTYITGRETPCAFSSAALARGFVILSLKQAELPVEGEIA